MRSHLLGITVFILLAVGGFLLGDGCWIRVKAVLAQQLLQHAWEVTMKTGEPTKAWPWADTWPIGRLQMERLQVDLIVLEGEHGEVLAFGPGHIPTSSSPEDGGHCVLVGHRDSSFRFLQFLQPGDRLSLQLRDGSVQSYNVRSSTVHAAAALYFEKTTDTSLLTLITCYPFESIEPGADLRYIVFLEKTGPVQDTAGGNVQG